MDQGKTIFHLRSIFARIDSAFYQLEHQDKIKLGSGSFGKHDGVTRLCFAKQKLLDQIQENVKVLPLSTEEAQIGYKIINHKVYKYILIVTENDFPEAHIWGIFTEIMAVRFYGMSDELEMTFNLGTMSRGDDFIDLYIYDMERVKRQEMDLELYPITHDCNERAAYDGFLDFRYYIEFQRDTEYTETIPEIGKMKLCANCGKQLFFDQIKPKDITAIYRKYQDRL